MNLFPPEPEPFGCLLADPPWQERGGGKIKRGADRHYPLLDGQGIVDAIRGSGLFRPAANAHLWMWATNNFLGQALWCIERLGFRYVTNAVWVKDRFGLGQYLRGQHEPLLFAVRGKGQHPDAWTGARNVPSVIRAPRGRHSAKPDESYRLIERVSCGPFVEFFARRAFSPAWTTWGNDPAVSEAAE